MLSSYAVLYRSKDRKKMKNYIYWQKGIVICMQKSLLGLAEREVVVLELAPMIFTLFLISKGKIHETASVLLGIRKTSVC